MDTGDNKDVVMTILAVMGICCAGFIVARFLLEADLDSLGLFAAFLTGGLVVWVVWRLDDR